jgi:peptidoglycan hydrolase-like protein with peptidoglycan-binding domain
MGNPVAPRIVFTANFYKGAHSQQVRDIQAYLNAHGFPVAATGAGSPGSETDYFGPATKAALAKFQKAHGILPATGGWGPKTRAFVNGQ